MDTKRKEKSRVFPSHDPPRPKRCPDGPGVEEKMGDANPRRGILIVLILAGLGALVACGASKQQPTKTTEQGAERVEHDVDLKKGEKVRVVTVNRGQTIKFVAANLTVFIVIPDPELQEGNGCEDWTSTESYVAFKIHRGSARVIVPDNYPSSGHDTDIWYSVMVSDGVDWEYLHGENPPPRIRIP